MTTVDHVAAIRRDATAIFDLCAQDPERWIPTCPAWLAKDLVHHVLETFQGAIEGFGEGDLPAPADGLDLALRLLTDDATAAPDVSQECAIHRWDAESAFGVDAPFVDPDVACEGVVGFFGSAWPMLLDHLRRPAGHGEVLVLRRTDGPERWRIVLADRAQVTTDDGGGDVEVSGRAGELFLWIWGRSDPPHVDGDVAVLEGIRNPAGRFLSPGF